MVLIAEGLGEGLAESVAGVAVVLGDGEGSGVETVGGGLLAIGVGIIEGELIASLGPPQAVSAISRTGKNFFMRPSEILPHCSDLMWQFRVKGVKIG